MPLINAANSILVIIDFQARLMPAIHDGPRIVANARRLVDAAGLLAVPILIQVFFNSGLAYWLYRRVGEKHSISCPSALIGASNFFELAVAAAISGRPPRRTLVIHPSPSRIMPAIACPPQMKTR